MRIRTNLTLHGRAVVAAAGLLLALAGCGSDAGTVSGTGSGPNEDASLTLVAFSAPREAFEEIIPAFNRTRDGGGVVVEQSYGSSGDQSRMVEGGLGADVVDLSLEPDMTRLVRAGLVDEAWNDDQYRGMVSTSVAVLIVRDGNPKGIRSWDDLLDDGVEVLTPNPFTSGGARWNIMAAYGAWTRGGDSSDEALAKLERMLRNAPVQPTSAREALQLFTRGEGDVMIAYENEAVTAQAKGEPIDYVVPPATILIENPGAVLETSEHPVSARAFLEFVHSPEAQRILGEKGFRPVRPELLEEFGFEQPDDLFTIDDLGGWEQVAPDFFDRFDGKVAKITKEIGADRSR